MTIDAFKRFVAKFEKLHNANCKCGADCQGYIRYAKIAISSYENFHEDLIKQKQIVKEAKKDLFIMKRIELDSQKRFDATARRMFGLHENYSWNASF
ncbi:hypothetical protein E6Q11_06460 [Candidatus Dojkabacteria bacterium]|uniref:Uncharacterized protein n=1 Tax=Candidatus Dojkabacteria bacterium TaxID=2099670 RepID=A0A5C7J2T8_9BACT|nr:MAG: hypothetical protein E6Q11_06460 [Candidatus Dojkabacteria bacterium]